jgi:hypothetical protein
MTAGDYAGWIRHAYPDAPETLQEFVARNMQGECPGYYAVHATSFRLQRRDGRPCLELEEDGCYTDQIAECAPPVFCLSFMGLPYRIVMVDDRQWIGAHHARPCSNLVILTPPSDSRARSCARRGSPGGGR